MGKSHRLSKRGDHYQTIAAGYQILRSPLANSYGAAAKHYRESDSALDQVLDAPSVSENRAAQKPEFGGLDHG